MTALLFLQDEFSIVGKLPNTTETTEMNTALSSVSVEVVEVKGRVEDDVDRHSAHR